MHPNSNYLDQALSEDEGYGTGTSTCQDDHPPESTPSCPCDIITVSASGACSRLTSVLDDLTKYLQAQQPSSRHHNFDSNIQDDADTKKIKLQAKSFRLQLLSHRESSYTVGPIIFIASNIGISIVKEALAADLADRTVDRGSILRQTRCLVFHEGPKNGRGHRAQVYMPEIVEGCASYYYISTLQDVDITTPNYFNVGANVTFRRVLSIPLSDDEGPDSIDSKSSGHQVSTTDEDSIVGAASEQAAEDTSRHTTPMSPSAIEPSHSTYNGNVLESFSSSVPAKQPTLRGTRNGVKLWNKLFNVIRAVDRLNPSTKPPSPSVSSVNRSLSFQTTEGTNDGLSDHQCPPKTSGFYTGLDRFLRRSLSIGGGHRSCSPGQMHKLISTGSLRSRKIHLFYTSTSVFREILIRLSLWQYLPCALRDLAGDWELVLLRYITRAFINPSDRVSALMSIARTMTISPLTLAAACGDQQVVRVLLELGISPRAKDRQYGRSALSIAIRYGRMRIAESLIAYGVLPDKKLGIARVGPLHQAVIYGLPHLSMELLRNGASIDDAQMSLLPDDQRMWLSRMLLMFRPNTAAPQQACTTGRDPNAQGPAKHRQSSQPQAPKKQGAKRSRANEEDEDEAQKNSSKRPDTGGKKDQEVGVEEQYLCPYYINDPGRHKRCRNKKWVKSELRRMKSHLKDAHYISICTSCHLILKSEPQLLSHVTNYEHVQHLIRKYIDGLDSLQFKAVTDKSNTWGKSGQDYWNEVWKILFPDQGDQPFPSPFADITGRELDEILRQQRIETVRLEGIANHRQGHARHLHLREQVVNRLRSELLMTDDAVADIESLFDLHSPQSPEVQVLLEVGALERTQRQNMVPSSTRSRGPARQRPNINEDYPQSDGRSDDIPIDPALHSSELVPGSVSRSPRATMEIYGTDHRREAFDTPIDPPIVSSSAFLLPPMQTAQGVLGTSGTRSSSPGRQGLPQSSNALDSSTMDRSSQSSIHTYNGPGSQFDEALHKLSSGEDI